MSYRKPLSGATANLCRELPQPLSEVTENLCRELPQTSVGSYHKHLSRVYENLCLELPQTFVVSYRKPLSGVTATLCREVTFLCGFRNGFFLRGGCYIDHRPKQYISYLLKGGYFSVSKIMSQSLYEDCLIQVLKICFEINNMQISTYIRFCLPLVRTKLAWPFLLTSVI